MALYWPEQVKNVLDDILEVFPEEFNVAEILQKTDWDPLPLFAFKHKRMNVLLSAMYRSLKQLGLSLKARDFFINSTVALLHILELSVAFFGNGSYSL